MNDEIREIRKQVDAISDLEDSAQLEALELATQRYFSHSEAAEDVGVWFRLFERFPEDDACGIFWGILHGIESLPGYESDLIASIRRRPSQFPVLMINRMLNGGRSRADGVDLLDLLRSIAEDPGCPASVRDDARGFVEWQQGSG